MNWTSRDGRIYDGQGREVAVATKAEPSLRATVNARAALIVRAVNSHAELVAALRNAERVLAAVSDLAASYPRPSNDPNGRTLLDLREIPKAAAFAARAALAKVEGGQP